MLLQSFVLFAPTSGPRLGASAARQRHPASPASVRQGLGRCSRTLPRTLPQTLPPRHDARAVASRCILRVVASRALASWPRCLQLLGRREKGLAGPSEALLSVWRGCWKRHGGSGLRC